MLEYTDTFPPTLDAFAGRATSLADRDPHAHPDVHAHSTPVRR